MSELTVVEHQIRMLLKRRAELKVGAAAGPLSFDEWLAANREQHQSPLMPWRVYSNRSIRNCWLDRVHADARNARGFFQGEEPVVMMGSRWAMLHVHRDGKEWRLADDMMQRYVRRYKPTLWTRKQISEYTLNLQIRVAKKLGTQQRYIGDPIFLGCMGLDSEDFPGFIWRGKAHKVQGERLAMLRSMFAVEQKLAKLPG